MNMENLMSPTVAEIAKALAAAQGEMSGAKKDSANPFFKSKYADLAAVVGAIREPLSKNGIAHIQVPGSDGDGFFVDTILMHTSGEWIKGRIRMNPVREDPQGIGSVITYMRRYALQAMAGLEAEDDDGNRASHSDGAPVRPAPKPLPAGSYQIVQTISTPSSRPLDVKSTTVIPVEGTGNWRDVICHLGTDGGRVKGKKLQNLTQTSIDWCEKKLLNIKEPTQQDNLLRAALALRSAELTPIPAQSELGSSRVNLNALQAKCEEANVPLSIIVKVAKSACGADAEYFADIDESAAGYMVANWSDTLEAIKFETDDLPK